MTWTPTNTATVNTPTKTPTVNTPTRTATITYTPTANLTFYPTPFRSIAVSDSASGCVTVGQSISVTAIFGPTNQQNQTDDYSIGFGNGITIVWGNGCTASYNTGSLPTSKPVTVVKSVTVPATVTSGGYTNLDVVGIQNSTYLCGGSTILGSVSISMCSGGKSVKPSPQEGGIGIVTPTQTLSPTPASEQRSLPSVIAAPNISRDGEPIEFRVQLAEPAQMKLTLYDLLGERVYQTSAAGNKGLNTLEWDLVNSGGNQVASGLYVYVVEMEGPAGPIQRMGKVIVMR
jgi:hypothetical protein